MIKFLWWPNSPENEAKFLGEMAKPINLNSERIGEIQDNLAETAMKMSGAGKVKGKVSELITSNLIPALELGKFEMRFRVLKKIVPVNLETEKAYYICGFTIYPGVHEASFAMVATKLGLEKLLYIIGFDYGRVRFIQ